MLKSRVKWANTLSCPVYLLLQSGNVPALFFIDRNLVCKIAYLVFNRAILWLVRRTWDDCESARTSASCNSLVDVGCMMRSQIVLQKHSMIISIRNWICFDVAADMITKVTEHHNSCSTILNTADPSPGILYRPELLGRQTVISRLDCKQTCELVSHFVMPLLTYSITHQSPAAATVTLLQTSCVRSRLPVQR